MYQKYKSIIIQLLSCDIYPKSTMKQTGAPVPVYLLVVQVIVSFLFNTQSKNIKETVLVPGHSRVPKFLLLCIPFPDILDDWHPCQPVDP